MSFGDLQKARQQRLKSHTSHTTQTSQEISSNEDARASGEVSPQNETPDLVKITPGMLKDLPPSIDIRTKRGLGRGLYVSRTVGDGCAAGSVLFSVTPHVHSLSTNDLSSCCSYCCAESEPRSLKRCSICKVVWYDSVECQKSDWKLHKEECQAIRRWVMSADARTPNTVRGREDGSSETPGALPLPNDAVRGLSRLLWSMEKAGLATPWTQEVFQMQSNRVKLSPTSAAHGSLISLGHALAVYLGANEGETFGTGGILKRFGIDSPRDFVDMLSRFTTNAVTLTTPTLTPIGVFVSPIIALINHSCRPNAVIVFPNNSSPNAVKKAQVVALRHIAPGEQIFTAYIDVSQTTPSRLRELRESYLFDCKCEACDEYSGGSGDPDPRESLLCPSCGALTMFSHGIESSPLKASLICGACETVLVVEPSKLHDALGISKEALQKARKIETTDPTRALKYTTNSLAFLSPYPLHNSCDPLLALSRLHGALLIHELSTLPEPRSIQEQENRDAKVDETCRAAARVVSGVCEDRAFCFGHPVRGVALAELGKLLCVDVSPGGPGNNGAGLELESWSRIPRGAARLHLAAQVLSRAQKELEIGFGKSGGDVGKSVRMMLTDLEREVGAWRKVKRSGAFQALGNVGGGEFRSDWMT